MKVQVNHSSVLLALGDRNAECDDRPADVDKRAGGSKQQEQDVALEELVRKAC